MIRDQRARSGVTLVELMVVLVILGVMAGVTGIAFLTRAPVPEVNASLALVARVREKAVQSGQSATVMLAIHGAAYLATAFPDGRVVTNAPIEIDQLSGRPSDAAR